MYICESARMYGYGLTPDEQFFDTLASEASLKTLLALSERLLDTYAASFATGLLDRTLENTNRDGSPRGPSTPLARGSLTLS